jgi:hypothetical protein
VNASKSSRLLSTTGPHRKETGRPAGEQSKAGSESTVNSNQYSRARPESPAAEGVFVTFPRRALTDECKCLQGIPLALPIPTKPGELCPYLGEGRGSIYDLIKQRIIFRFKTRGLKEGASSVYGPSVCDAKYGCRCGYRHRLAELRNAKQKTGCLAQDELNVVPSSSQVPPPQPSATPNTAASEEVQL